MKKAEKYWDQLTSLLRNNAVIIILTILYISFHRFWEDLIGKQIITPFLKHFESNQFNDTLFFIAVALCFTSYLFNLGKKNRQQTIIISIILIGIWYYYRWNCVFFGFIEKEPFYGLQLTSLHTIETLKYVDIVPLFALCKLINPNYNTIRHLKDILKKIVSYLKIDILINRIIVFLKIKKIKIIILNSLKRMLHYKIKEVLYKIKRFLKKIYVFFKKKNKQINQGFFEDIPIDNPNEDILGRKEQAEKATDLLLRTDTSKGSFTFGINAPWGAGKSSFMKMMKEYIHKKSTDSITLDFNPWLYAAEKDLVSVFFEELSKSLKRFDYSLSKNIINYSALLSAFDTKETKVTASLINLIHPDSLLKDKKDQIAKAIKNIQRKIIVFIDDLDRLEASELMEMMKLIRNISDFPYIYFIAAYDKSYLVKCLDEKMDTKGIDFTDKIFQVELQPLEGPSMNLNLELEKMLEERFDSDFKEDDDYISFVNWARTDSLFVKLLSNIREIKRLVNSFILSYEFLEWKVSVHDLLLIELFKTKYPLAFFYFAKNRTSFFKSDEGYMKIIKDTYDDKSFLSKQLQSKKTELKINESDIDAIDSIIRILFPESISTDANYLFNGINDEDSFDNYFVPDLSETEIALSEFNETMETQNLEFIKEKINKWSKYKKRSLSDRLRKYEPSDKEDLKTLIQILVFSINTNLVQNISGEFVSDCMRKLSIYNSNQKYLPEDKKFIERILTENRYDINICIYLNSLLLAQDKWDFPLSKEKVIYIQTNLFFDCLHRHSNDFKQIFYGFIFTVDLGVNIKWNFCLNTSVIDKMKSFAKQNILLFIQAIIVPIRPARNRMYYSLNQIPELLWGSNKCFYDYISSLKVDDPQQIIPEFIQFFKEFEKNKYERIQFVFNQIKPETLKHPYNRLQNKTINITTRYIKKLIEYRINTLLTGQKPNEGLVYQEIGMSYFYQDKYKEALKYLNKAMEDSRKRKNALGRNSIMRRIRAIEEAMTRKDKKSKKTITLSTSYTRKSN